MLSQRKLTILILSCKTLIMAKRALCDYDRIKHYNNSFKEKRISLPKKKPLDKQVAFSKKTTEQPIVEDDTTAT